MGGGEGCCVVARQEARLQFNEPVPTDNQGPPLPSQLRLEYCLVKLRVAEGEEGRGPALHRCDEALLALDEARHVAVPGLAQKIQAALRLAPHRALQQKFCAHMGYAVTSKGQIPGLDRSANARPSEIDRARDRLRPEGSDCRQ